MARWVVGLFFITHGLVHLAVWLAPYKEEGPFNPSHSWLMSLLGPEGTTPRAIAVTLAVITAVGFVLAGFGWLGAREWAESVAVWSALASLLLVVLYFNLWLSFAVLIDLAIIYTLWR